MKKTIIFVFILVILIQLCSAYTHLNIYIDETGEALFLGETNEELELPKGIELENGEIKGTTQELTDKNGEIWSFSYSLEGANLYIILPKGTKIKEISNGEIGFEKDQFSVYAIESIEIDYKIGDVDENYTLYFVLILVIVTSIAFYFFKKRKIKPKKELKPDKTKIIENMLNDREKLIIDKLKETGKIKGSRLRKLVDVPKASFSRHVQELERKKLIKRTGEGKNKFIELIK